MDAKPRKKMQQQLQRQVRYSHFERQAELTSTVGRFAEDGK